MKIITKPNILVSFEIIIFSKGNLSKVPSFYHFYVNNINVIDLPITIAKLTNKCASKLNITSNSLDYKITKIEFKSYEGR